MLRGSLSFDLLWVRLAEYVLNGILNRIGGEDMQCYAQDTFGKDCLDQNEQKQCDELNSAWSSGRSDASSGSASSPGPSTSKSVVIPDISGHR